MKISIGVNIDTDYLLQGQVVALLGVSYHQDLSCQQLSLFGKDWLRKKTSNLRKIVAIR